MLSTKTLRELTFPKPAQMLTLESVLIAQSSNINHLQDVSSCFVKWFYWWNKECLGLSRRTDWRHLITLCEIVTNNDGNKDNGAVENMVTAVPQQIICLHLTLFLLTSSPHQPSACPSSLNPQTSGLPLFLQLCSFYILRLISTTLPSHYHLGNLRLLS